MNPNDPATALDVPIAIVSSKEVADICLLFGDFRKDNGQIVNLETTPYNSVVWNSVEISLVDFVEKLEESDSFTDLLLVYDLKDRELYSAKDIVELFQRVSYRHGCARYLRLILFSSLR